MHPVNRRRYSLDSSESGLHRAGQDKETRTWPHIEIRCWKVFHGWRVARRTVRWRICGSAVSAVAGSCERRWGRCPGALVGCDKELEWPRRSGDDSPSVWTRHRLLFRPSSLSYSTMCAVARLCSAAPPDEFHIVLWLRSSLCHLFAGKEGGRWIKHWVIDHCHDSPGTYL